VVILDFLMLTKNSQQDDVTPQGKPSLSSLSRVGEAQETVLLLVHDVKNFQNEFFFISGATTKPALSSSSSYPYQLVLACGCPRQTLSLSQVGEVQETGLLAAHVFKIFQHEFS